VDRLYDSARALWLEVPIPREELGRVIEEAVRRSGLAEAYVRPIVTRGVGDLGLDPRKCVRPSVIVIVDAIRMWPAELYDRGLNVITAATPIPHRESLSPRVKSLNYLAHILARIEGINAGADEVLMLDSAGHVAEGSGENVFVVRDRVIRTPPAWSGILRGVTRDAVIELARGAGYDLREEVLNRYDIYTADEAFFSGTAAEVVAIRALDGRAVGAGRRGPVTADLAERYRALTRG
jgi:branched-chain amino acid aminotransferase